MKDQDFILRAPTILFLNYPSFHWFIDLLALTEERQPSSPSTSSSYYLTLIAAQYSRAL